MVIPVFQTWDVECPELKAPLPPSTGFSSTGPPSNRTPSNRTPSNRTPSNRTLSNRTPSNRTLSRSIGIPRPTTATALPAELESGQRWAAARRATQLASPAGVADFPVTERDESGQSRAESSGDAVPPSANVWPQPLGSTNVSPRALHYRSPQPVTQAELWTPGAWVEAVPQVEATPRPTSINSPGSGEVAGSPRGGAANPESPDGLVPPPTPPQISTALPIEYSVPMWVPVGPSTGHSSSFVAPWVSTAPESTSSRAWAKSPVRHLLAVQGFLTRSELACCHLKRRRGPAGFGIKFYDRYNERRLTATDVSARIKGAPTSTPSRKG